jgi:hypothetical protein
MEKTLQNVQAYILEQINEDVFKNKYTDQKWFYRIKGNVKLILEQNEVESENNNTVFLATYLLQLTYLGQTYSFFELDKDDIQKNASLIQAKFYFDKTTINKALDIAIEATLEPDLQKTPSKVISDAFLMDFSCPINGENRILKVYDQLVAKGFTHSKLSWIDDFLAFMKSKSFQTSFADEQFSSHKKDLQKKLKKEEKQIKNQNDLLLEKELNISEDELKSLKKQLSKIKGRDDRGIQTLFRTTSKNHYTLKGLVDDKARIMITVNSIILSLIIGRIIGSDDTSNINSQLPFITFAIINVLSILFAILAITPIKTQGKFTEGEIRNKQGNLLYFGNFHNMKYPDFEWGFLQLLNDKDYLYLSMIRDLYYQGVQLHKKFTRIRFSLYIFLAGIILTSIIFLISTIDACTF